MGGLPEASLIHILEKVYKNGSITKSGLKEYFDKRFKDALTKNERVILHKGIKKC
jgi:hypothetical protein